MKRNRQVFPTGEIAHKWAHQLQESARNPQGNLFFVGATIYSYRRNWPLARIYTRRGKAPLVLTNSNTYSVTTSQHQSAVNRAANHLRHIAVPHCDFDTSASYASQHHKENLAHLVETAAADLKRAQRSMSVWRVENARDNAAEALQAARDYATFFGLRNKIPAFTRAEWDAAVIRARAIENPDPASVDKRERARAQRAVAKHARLVRERALREVHIAANRSAWRLGAYSYHSHMDGPVMLRIAGDEIETSMGARIPISAAPAVWNMVEFYRSRLAAYGRTAHEFKREGLGDSRLKIGDYAVDRVDADGTLRVGCHTIPHSELRTMARALKLVPVNWKGE